MSYEEHSLSSAGHDVLVLMRWGPAVACFTMGVQAGFMKIETITTSVSDGLTRACDCQHPRFLLAFNDHNSEVVFVWEHDSDAVGAIRGCVRDHDYRFRCMHYLRQNIEACCKGIDASWSGKQGTCFKAQSFEILMRWQYS